MPVFVVRSGLLTVSPLLLADVTIAGADVTIASCYMFITCGKIVRNVYREGGGNHTAASVTTFSIEFFCLYYSRFNRVYRHTLYCLFFAFACYALLGLYSSRDDCANPRRLGGAS